MRSECEGDRTAGRPRQPRLTDHATIRPVRHVLVLVVREPRMIDYGTGRPVRRVLVLVLVVREGGGLLLLALSLQLTLVLLLALMLLIALVLLALFLLEQHKVE